MSDTFPGLWTTPEEMEQLEEDAALGAAFRRCEAALPEGYTLELRVYRHAGLVRAEPPARPGNRGSRQPRWVEGFGWPDADSLPTPTAALEALAEKLESLRP